MMSRNPKASLSPREVRALRALKQAFPRPIEDSERRLFLSMGLVSADGQETKLSVAGWARLKNEDRFLS